LFLLGLLGGRRFPRIPSVALGYGRRDHPAAGDAAAAAEQQTLVF
jgi:hypothetical protein